MSVSEESRKGKGGDSARKDENWFLETGKVIVQALILALIIRTLFFQPFNIPSGSMKSTLLVGDYLFVSKYSYGYSKHSMPYSPSLFDGRIWSAPPERGDVAVFKLPRDGRTDYIKRVIGIPGDEIQMISGVLHINGNPVEREKIEDFEDQDSWGRTRTVARYRETLPNGVSYETLDLEPNGLADNTRPYKVPEGHYFMMGDNRDNSTDSRFLDNVGFVPFENFVGKAQVIFFSLEEGTSAFEIWRWPTDIRWGRLFRTI